MLVIVLTKHVEIKVAQARTSWVFKWDTEFLTSGTQDFKLVSSGY